MDVLEQIMDWLAANESTLSALTAITAIIGVLIAVLAFLFPRFGRMLRRRYEALDATLGDRLPDLKRPGGPVGKAALAVLPFKALSHNDDDVHLATGISSEIIADLASLPDIRVSSHVASFMFQGEQIDLAQVADVLSVRYVVTGSLQHSADRIQVFAELTDVVDGEQLWSGTYKREFEDLFELQESIAEAVAGAIGGELKLVDTFTASQSPTRSLDAWGLVQKAFHFWLTGFHPEKLAEAMKLLKQAIRIDPEYAAAHAYLALILSHRSMNAMTSDPAAERQQALDTIERAFRISPKDLVVLENAGLVWTHHGEGKRATLALRQAVKQSPLDLMARGYLGFNLALTGSDAEAEEALQILDRNLSIAPKHPSRGYWCYFKSLACTRLGRLDEAEALANEALVLQPGFYMSAMNLANVLGRAGRYDDAKATLGKALAINPFMTVDFYAHVVDDICDDAVLRTMLDGYFAAGLIDRSATANVTEAETTPA